MSVDFSLILFIVGGGLVFSLYYVLVSVQQKRGGSRLHDIADETGYFPQFDEQGGRDDLWEWRHQNIPLRFYGGGAEHAFDHYFTRVSRVDVSSVEEIINWLLDCQYVADSVQFNKRDHWQHPVDFEHTRQGDCEDFALWAWRKLVELGYEAEFMVGKWVRGERIGTHAWVLLEHNGERFLFESTGRARERVLRPYEEAYLHYIPFASVDRALRKKVYNGLVHWIMKLT